MTTIPVLNSKPGAAKKLYLDFDGQTMVYLTQAGPKTITTAPAYSRDADGKAISAIDLAAIVDIWARGAVALADYAIDVTTEPAPDVLADRVAMKVLVGGSGGEVAAPKETLGCAFPNAFVIQELGNVAYVFSAKVSGEQRRVAWAILHEVGHMLGLSHQSGSGLIMAASPSGVDVPKWSAVDVAKLKTVL